MVGTGSIYHPSLYLSPTWPGLMGEVLSSGAAEKALEINNDHTNGHMVDDPGRHGGLHLLSLLYFPALCHLLKGRVTKHHCSRRHDNVSLPVLS